MAKKLCMAKKLPVSPRAIRVRVAGKLYRVVLTLDAEDGWIADVPDLPGCVSQGDTLVEVRMHIRETIAAYHHGPEIEPVHDAVTTLLKAVTGQQWQRVTRVEMPSQCDREARVVRVPKLNED